MTAVVSTGSGTVSLPLFGCVGHASTMSSIDGELIEAPVPVDALPAERHVDNLLPSRATQCPLNKSQILGAVVLNSATKDVLSQEPFAMQIPDKTVSHYEACIV
eukprot:6075023-Amphidinium_carterae.3